jgi:hypothetical protein
MELESKKLVSLDMASNYPYNYTEVVIVSGENININYGFGKVKVKNIQNNNLHAPSFYKAISRFEL